MDDMKQWRQADKFESINSYPLSATDSSHTTEQERINLGSYYTPPKLVDLCYELVSPYIRTDTIFLDSSAGCGSFISTLSNHHFIAADINAQAIRFLNGNYPYARMIKHDNSLLNVSRAKYGLTRQEHLIIIGNPPYNDRTSKNRRSKKNGSVEMDASLMRADMGMAFLLSYAELQADVVCVLHPLSYLIKPANFRKLAPFWCHYKLEKGILFSSHLFNNTGSTAFPIVIALYRRGESTSMENLASHSFEVLDRDTHFIVNRIETIDGYIRKYPPCKDEMRPSDMGLYFYNFRDSNSLWTSANFTNKRNYAVHITVDEKDFYKYSYLSCYKRYFPRSYVFGNTSPLVERDLLENSSCFRSACMVDTVLNIHLSPLTDASFRKKLAEKIQTLLRDDVSPLAEKIKNITQANFIGTKSSLAAYFTEYFAQLEKKNLA